MQVTAITTIRNRAAGIAKQEKREAEEITGSNLILVIAMVNFNSQIII